MGQAQLLDVTPGRGDAQTAIVFVHGFGGDAAATWGDFPTILRDQAASLADWAIYSLGYSSTLLPDIRGVWAGDPGIDTLATYLRTRAIQEPLKTKRIALIAHSMGGLVVQKALVTYPDLAARTSHVLLYGTPSNGIRKSAGLLGRLFKRQTEDMGLGGEFVPALRKSWEQRFQGERPFGFWAIAGDRDEFVPASSSLAPFAEGDRIVVPGNHLQIVKPEAAEGLESMSVKAAVDAITGDAAPGGPWNAARVAVELGSFQAAIERLLPNAGDLDQANAVALALALDGVGRRDEAIEVLKQRLGKPGTDAMGTLAGRLKRVWLAEGTETPAREALGLYRTAYDLSVEAGDPAQAFYHGINLAFMKFAFERDAAGAADMATRVLDHCRQAPKRDVWSLAATGEAKLYLGKPEDAFQAYEDAVATDPAPWQMKSIFIQAMQVVDAMDDADARRRLREIFRRTVEEENIR